ncbi:MFS transporter [Microbacterium sp. Root61]|uniref:MFS transporter n=1 Tax=Microbacterium sp. Root61 TaxID=1736570 RepID=UPI0006F76884|nr:MFS transporter [Microbacterium sp. Root61]KRA23640.1 MFS transporter [Microbacterium sp. Root61]
MSTSILTEAELGHAQNRIVGVLAAGQVLGGIAFGSTISLGALLARTISGQDALSGFATAFLTLGAALCAIPLAALAARHGRRRSLTLGNALALVGIIVVVSAAALSWFPLLLLGFILIGAGNAGNLQSRFAATDLAPTARRGRDLSIVVWATTVGAVLGPNLLEPGEVIGAALGMPPLTGAYVFSIVAQLCALALYLIALRPDPLLTAQRLALQRVVRADHIVEVDRPRVARYAIIAVAGSHAVMASVMAMTPVHLVHHGATLSIVGLTISLHVAGMYALSPVFGILADRWGRVRVIMLGQAILAASLLTAAFAGSSEVGVTLALILLGLGWSAATVAGSALLTEASATQFRPKRQGRSDSLMSLSAAVGAILAGLILGWIGYGGLALVALAVVAAVVVMSPMARIPRAAASATVD